MAFWQNIARVPTFVGVLFLLVGVWPGSTARAQCPSPAATGAGSRYLEVVPPEHPDPVAIFVSQSPPNIWCSKYVDAAGRLTSEPFFQTPALWGTVYVRGEEIVPSATYNIQTDCGAPGAPILSTPPVSAATWKWGDTNADGVTDFVDITRVVDGFRGVWHNMARPCTTDAECTTVTPHRKCDTGFGYCIAITREDVDLYGTGDSLPDRKIDFTDVVSCVDAFRGLAYPQDCNGNRVFDACDLAVGFSLDCQPNDIPDECETDCQNNGFPDDCDIRDGRSDDCQPNGVPDECDPDCDGDGIPDDCDAWEDMDSDGIADCWDDCDNNPPNRACVCPELCNCYFPSTGITIPDYPRWACILNGGTCVDCPSEYWCRDGCLIGDFDFDGDVDYADLGQIQICLNAWQSGCERGDYEPDGDVDCDDWAKFKVVWTEPSPPPPWPPCDG
jgi:hypothetical protein